MKRIFIACASIIAFALASVKLVAMPQVVILTERSGVNGASAGESICCANISAIRGIKPGVFWY